MSITHALERVTVNQTCAKGST